MSNPRGLYSNIRRLNASAISASDDEDIHEQPEHLQREDEEDVESDDLLENYHQNHPMNDQDDEDDYDDHRVPMGAVPTMSPQHHDTDNHMLSRHSEANPYDQDVVVDTAALVANSADTNTPQAQPDTTTMARSLSDSAVPSSSSTTAANNFLGVPSSAMPHLPSSSSSSLSPSTVTSPTSSSSSSSSTGGLRKSVSIPEKLAGRAREIAVTQGRRLDELVRGIDSVQRDYVEDHVLETLDYENHEDTMNELEIEKSGALHTNYLLTLKIIMMILIGLITALLMYCVSQASDYIYTNKITATTTLISNGQAAAAYFAFLFMNLGLTAVASSLEAIGAPHAKGGGVPYALSYLNGTNVAEYFSPRIVAIKTLSLIFTISGGLTLGMEGPFVFIGGGVALLCSNFIDRVFPFFFITFDGRRTFSRVIRNIREERIFMAGGLAAGLAVAFDAPIAGVLFALEGSTTFLTVPVVLRIFGCAMFASFFNDLGHNNFSSQVINHNLLTPTTAAATASPWAFSIPELLPFTILGLMGGLAGAGATWMNIQISSWRHHYIEGKTWKDIGKQVAEIAVLSFVTSTIWFVLPYIFGCRAVGPQCATNVNGSTTGESGPRCEQLQCNSGFYSEIGAFVYSSSDEIARLLFDRSLSYAEDYSALPLIFYGIAYWVLVSLIYGAYVPGGLFVPSIIVGGVYGRVTGICVEYIFPNSYINPGVYALLGAASMLGGFTRLALPVVLMLIELTGDATYLLPIMYCAMLGKFFADYLYPSLYPQHMKMEGIPTLTDKLNPLIAQLHAAEVMIKKDRLACICAVERLSTIRSVLLTSRRIIFPILTPAGELVGLIKRDALMTAEKFARPYKTYAEAEILEDPSQYNNTNNTDGNNINGDNNNGNNRKATESGWRKFKRTKIRPPISRRTLPEQEKKWMDWHQSSYTNNSSLSSSSFGEIDEEYINLKNYADCGMICAHPATSTVRLAICFRRLGISHLCVTDRRHRFLGFITRRCLIVPPAALNHLDADNPQHAQQTIQTLQQEQSDTISSIQQDQQVISETHAQMQQHLQGRQQEEQHNDSQDYHDDHGDARYDDEEDEEKHHLDDHNHDHSEHLDDNVELSEERKLYDHEPDLELGSEDEDEDDEKRPY